MTYEDFKYLNRRTNAHKVLRDEAFNIAKNLKYDEYQRGLASMVYRCLHKKTSGIATTLANKCAFKNETIYKNKLAEELQKPIIRKFKRKRYTHYLKKIFRA